MPIGDLSLVLAAEPLPRRTLLLCALVLGVGVTAVRPLGAQPATKQDLQLVIQAMEKRFEAVDKRFEVVDKRFEALEKGLDFLQSVMLTVLGFVLASPFVVEYLARRRAERDQAALEDSRKMLFALREAAQRDKNLANALRVAGLAK